MLKVSHSIHLFGQYIYMFVLIPKNSGTSFRDMCVRGKREWNTIFGFISEIDLEINYRRPTLNTNQYPLPSDAMSETVTSSSFLLYGKYVQYCECCDHDRQRWPLSQQQGALCDWCHCSDQPVTSLYVSNIHPCTRHTRTNICAACSTGSLQIVVALNCIQ